MGGIGQFNQPKSGPFTPTYSLLANNIGNGISRENQNPNRAIIKVPCATKGDTLEDNLSIPYVIGSSVSGSSSYFCTLDDNLDRAGAGAGVYRGLNVWNLTDYRSNQSGVSPLFMDYHPLDPVSPPPAPGGAISGNGADFSPCIHNTFQWIGDCAPGSSGIINFRPNPAFVPINPPAIAGSVRAARCLYVTRTTNPWYRWCYAKTVNAQSSDVYRTESADGRVGRPAPERTDSTAACGLILALTMSRQGSSAREPTLVPNSRSPILKARRGPIRPTSAPTDERLREEDTDAVQLLSDP